MNWKIKASIQNIVSMLPASLSFNIYYWLQKRFGALKEIKSQGLGRGKDVYVQLQKINRSPEGATFFDLGTGRRLMIPLALWLMGADSIYTIDINPYLIEEFIRSDVNDIVQNREKLLAAYNDRIVRDRIRSLHKFTRTRWTIEKLMGMCHIFYLAPKDARDIPLLDKSVDFYISTDVLEHIEPAVLKSILIEGMRVLKDDGALIHKIDFKDHFAYSDKSISWINFLKFSPKKWQRIAGNRYAYTNRLRIDDFYTLMEALGLKLLRVEKQVDHAMIEQLQHGGIELHESFSEKTEEVLAT